MFAWLDPGIGSQNAGDLVISKAIVSELPAVEGSVRISTHTHPSARQLGRLASADRVLVGGTNLLASHMERHRQWFVSPLLASVLWRKCIFVGVGWWQYQSEPCGYSRWLLRGIANPEMLHSARDEYTARRLRLLGLDAINTACPTMWSLPTSIAQERSKSAVATVTNYYRAADVDSAWLAAVAQSYERVTLVGMEEGDRAYVESLGILARGNVCYAGFGLDILDEALTECVEFIGTRLHAGIRALQAGRRCLILAVDNRATEIAASTSLPVLPRNDLQSINRWLCANESKLELTLPSQAIAAWLQKFARGLAP